MYYVYLAHNMVDRAKENKAGEKASQRVHIYAVWLARQKQLVLPFSRPLLGVSIAYGRPPRGRSFFFARSVLRAQLAQDAARVYERMLA
jgi:hypothetical protein